MVNLTTISSDVLLWLKEKKLCEEQTNLITFFLCGMLSSWSVGSRRLDSTLKPSRVAAMEWAMATARSTTHPFMLWGGYNLVKHWIEPHVLAITYSHSQTLSLQGTHHFQNRNFFLFCKCLINYWVRVTP